MSLNRHTRMRKNPAFTLPEVLVVIGIIAVLIALLLPALAGALRTSEMAKSQNSLKQIATLMRLYSGDNREFILPSQFDYSASAATYPVKVRSDLALAALRYKGTWTDILWTVYDMSPFKAGPIGMPPTNYTFDSPDMNLYQNQVDYSESPLRSSVPNSHDFIGAGTPAVPTPFGSGAKEGGQPGFFAANNFFNTDLNFSGSAQWYTTGQIKDPARSLYLVDSVAGETINPVLAPYDNQTDANGDGIPDTFEVDYRYNGSCLILFLDGHSRPEGRWNNLPDLESSAHKVKVRNLDNS